MSGSHIGGPAEHDNAFRCKECSATFDEPAVRPHGNRGGNISHGLAAQLDEMDADDVGRPVTDGGPGAGPNGEDLNTTQAVFRALEDLGGEREEAPVGNVINRVVVNHERPLGDVLDEVSRLMANGEIYAPSAATIRRTDAPVATDGSGAIDSSFEDAEQQTVFVGDHVRDLEDDDTTMLVVGAPAQTAEEYTISDSGMEPAETVADYNPEYPATDDVIETVYAQRTDNALATGNTYAFPRSRLELVASIHDVDSDEGGEDDA
ncbi:hypothetical protein [Haloarcula onubensis]|uniref:C2H2-type domain-containing protein n=1 Tax=Haloarcula onubensis TaxID=2950539 RepID=A0ABU2FVC3_9EURY|nr:hypothetical protein [Halomicroarcula sp. S3CR25-11]MDS0284705.1 hypothetical protein [Halomicroarcula sp. S3CR25-11]